MKYARHLLFWLVYCIYFYVQSIAPWSMEDVYNPATYKNALISMYCFIPVCILSVYVSLYFILPRYIVQKRYPAAIGMFIILFSADTVINYYAAQIYFGYSGVTGVGKGPFLLGYLNTIWAMIISGFAICLKITRKWYSQQKEIELITRQKARNELNLQKYKMHPGFLYSSLDSIYVDLKRSSDSSSSMILVLSNLLSYSLYDSKAEYVTLQSELNAVSDFISLERMKGSNDIGLCVDPEINAEELIVPPMIILSVLQEKGSVSEILVKQNEEGLLIKIVFPGETPTVIKFKCPIEEVYAIA